GPITRHACSAFQDRVMPIFSATIPARTGWPRPAALRQATATAPARRLVVVSNRLPIPSSKPSAAGGLAGAVQAALAQSGGVWFGWSGEVVSQSEAEATPNLINAGPVTYATLDLSRDDYEQYYNGYANRVLWPLFHYRVGLIEFRREDLEG